MKGRRLPDDLFYERLNNEAEGEVLPGDYGRCKLPRESGFISWWFMSPNGLIGRMATQAEPDGKGQHHEVEEHEDGAISVVPRPNNSNSIKVSDHQREWHGYIYHGEWKSV